MNKEEYEKMIKCIINLEGIINYIANGNNPDFIIWKRTPEEFIEELEKIKNIIDKQQKEIEELRAINEMQKYRIEVIDERELISKDKIKNKIKELEQIKATALTNRTIEMMNDKISILNLILEE